MRTMLKGFVTMTFVVFGCLMSTMVYSQKEAAAGWKGQVLDAAGKPVAGVSVRLRNTERGAVSDNAGHFVLDGVPAGNYTADITANGFMSYAVTVTIPF